MTNPYAQFENNNMLMGSGTGQQRTWRGQQWQGQNREKRTPWQGQRSATPYQAPEQLRQPPTPQYQLVGQAAPAPMPPTAWQGQQWQQHGQGQQWQQHGQGQQDQSALYPWLHKNQPGWNPGNTGYTGTFDVDKAKNDYDTWSKYGNRPMPHGAF